MIPLTPQQQSHLQTARWDQYVKRGIGLWCEVKTQTLWLISENHIHARYTCSTAAAGVGQQSNSYQTPAGWHEIDERIGHNAPIGAVFQSRKWTGKIWPAHYHNQNQPNIKETQHTPSESPTLSNADKDTLSDTDDLICSRILWLRGLEPGFNAGHNVDTHDRYIYIHGTNHEDRLGTPASHGCIRLSNSDTIDLFNKVNHGTPLWIDPTE